MLYKSVWISNSLSCLATGFVQVCFRINRRIEGSEGDEKVAERETSVLKKWSLSQNPTCSNAEKIAEIPEM